MCAGISELGEFDIKRDIFQGDYLSPLVLVLAWIPLTLNLRNVKAAYEFSRSKEKILVIEKKKDCEISWYRVARW